MPDPSLLANRLDLVLDDATIPELPNHYRGKVRDNYDLPDGRRILIATDRLSAFDRILTAIPLKSDWRNFHRAASVGTQSCRRVASVGTVTP